MRHIIAVVALLTSAHLAFAAEPPGIALAERPQLAAGLAAFPRITAPLTPATIKVNAALARADRRALAAAKACTATAGQQPAMWSRTVFVTMRTGRFIAFVASDDADCGGAHPDSGMLALVYDAITGAPMNWLPLFPNALAVTAADDSGIDGTPLGLIRSPKLLGWFARSLTADGAGDCRGLGDETSGFAVWPDPEAGGLSLFAEGVSFADAPCAGPVTMSYATLTTFGFPAALIATIKSAEVGRQYGPAYHGGK
jgi:hypothetical protein